MRIFHEYILLIPVIAWGVSVAAKGCLGIWKSNFSISQTFGSGGMPSVHSALVTSLTTAIGIKYGIFHDLFAICLIFSTIIIYDAINVRFEAGLHAKALNRISQDLERRFNESLGHLPKEAFVGSLLGIATALVCMSIG